MSARRGLAHARRALLAATVFGWPLLQPAPPACAQAPVAPASAARAGELVIVPDAFLRRWDPVTVFFPSDVGPAAGGAEDAPERHVRLTPAHPGAFTWLDARTLQFRPAEPWPPLERVTVEAAGRRVRLTTLLAPPVSSSPAAGTRGLEPVEEIALTFAEPVAEEALARALSIELAPLPGLGETGLRTLGPGDFEIKARERSSPSDSAVYVLRLRQPIPLGTRARIRFRASLDEPAERAAAELDFATAEPFRALRFGCKESLLPVVPTGARYSGDQALICDAGDPTLVVLFSAEPGAADAVAVRNLVRLSPPVARLEPTWLGRRLELRGEFVRERAYRLTLAPTPLADASGRPLELAAVNEATLTFPRLEGFLRWGSATGVVERRGPQMVPLAGRGDERVDLRIQRIDPLDRSFWPYPERPVAVDESRRPPGPGEEPAAHVDPESPPTPEQIAQRILALGSPPVSALVDLPLRRDSGSATFGLDLAPHLSRFAGSGGPGTYLVGLRRLGAEDERSWLRLQVTDLALSTLEEPGRVVFAVTSLADARPVAGAEVLVEGSRRAGASPAEWVELFRGRTDGAGLAIWPAPGAEEARRTTVQRIVVAAGDDRLVLDPGAAPERFADDRWEADGERWLQWSQEDLAWRGPQTQRLVHLFAERPVYRPEEPVHLKGYLRERRSGRFTPVTAAGFLVVEGPGDLEWRYPVEPTALGTVYWKFDERDLPTGAYRVRFEPLDGDAAFEGQATFRKEAYRLPRFEVHLDAPERTALDRDFEVQLTATYYAGGRVAARPVEWRVTQFPHDWTPKARPGFFFSSDGRFSRAARFESTPALERIDATDEDGGAELRLDPTIEPTAQPRVYVVEATVIGDDDQTVTATRQVVALPPFLLGLEVPRFLERAETVRPRIVAVGPDDGLVAGQPVKVRLIHRQWHSYLRASDFTDGVARYVTEIVDEPVTEREVVTGAEPVAIELPLATAGVYVVEVEARDRLGRAQTVAVDLFAGGEAPVTWSKPATAVFEVVPDQPKYRPGATARLVLASPFQTGEALAAVEAPDGYRYHWLPVRGGRAVLELPIEASWAPKIPVHFLLLRGRLAGTAPVPGNATDLGRPATFGATVWLEVEPRAHQLTLELEHPSRALPGQEIEIALKLADPDGAPLAGEVTLWLVDQAVLALGREARLDPLPSFLQALASYWSARDTRALVFGFLPFAARPGGGEGEEGRGILDRQTIRKNFLPVPFYDPAIPVGPDGRATVRVRLGDDLTNFKLRAKAVSGAERFGFATGHLEVRQPVVLQPALPRFVRPGDRFVASAVGRIVEGEGGAGSAEARVEGLALAGDARQPLEWVANRAVRLEFPVAVPTPEYDAAGQPVRDEVVLRIGAERAADHAGDAFEVRLPIRADRERVKASTLARLEPGKAIPLPEPTEPARAGTLRRSLLVASEPGIVEMASGLDFLLAYPYGCTEQRLSTTRAQVALRRFRDLLALEGDDAGLARAVADTVEWLGLVQQSSGLFAYWPGGEGSVALTAWAVELLAEVREAGLPVDGEVRDRALAALEQSLRSDSAFLLAGEAWAERTWALAALARAGRFDPAYGNELARRAQFLDLEHVASVLLAFDRAGQAGAPALPPLERELWSGVVTRLHQGREIYGGLQEKRATRSARILPSEARTLADMVRALVARADTPEEERKLRLLLDALVGLGRGDGWGTTNANAAAIAALAERLAAGATVGGQATLALASPDGARTIELAPGAPTARWISNLPGAASVTLSPGSSAAVVARAETSYLPASDGSLAPARREGFVVTREQLRIHGGETAPDRVPLETPGQEAKSTVGDVIEEHVEVVNPQDRHYVAVVVPLAAGMEPLNPALETAPPEAKPSGHLSLQPTYVAFLDDQIAFYYDTLPKGTFDFYFRSRAQIPGSFIQPPAKAEMMYDASVVGTSPGARVTVEAAPAGAN